MATSGVEQVIKQSGGIGALAERLGISPQAVHKWRKSGVPAERILELEELSGVPREVIRPDLYRKSRPLTATSRKAG